jgi:hypothetical protein
VTAPRLDAAACAIEVAIAGAGVTVCGGPAALELLSSSNQPAASAVASNHWRADSRPYGIA